MLDLQVYGKQIAHNVEMRFSSYPYNLVQFPETFAESIPVKSVSYVSQLEDEIRTLVGKRGTGSTWVLADLQSFFAEKLIKKRAEILAKKGELTISQLTTAFLDEHVEWQVLQESVRFFRTLNDRFPSLVKQSLDDYYLANSSNKNIFSRKNLEHIHKKALYEIERLERPEFVGYDFAHGKNQAKMAVDDYIQRIITLQEGGDYGYEPVQYMAYKIKKLTEDEELAGDMWGPPRRHDSVLVAGALRSIAKDLGIYENVKIMVEDASIDWREYERAVIERAPRLTARRQFLDRNMSALECEDFCKRAREIGALIIQSSIENKSILENEADRLRGLLSAFIHDFNGIAPNDFLNKWERRYEHVAHKNPVAETMMMMFSSFRKELHLPKTSVRRVDF